MKRVVAYIWNYQTEPAKPLEETFFAHATSRDMHPVVGRHPDHPNRGILSALGSKGVLYAPWLARQWVEHLKEGCEFDPDADVARSFSGG